MDSITKTNIRSITMAYSKLYRWSISKLMSKNLDSQRNKMLKSRDMIGGTAEPEKEVV